MNNNPNTGIADNDPSLRFHLTGVFKGSIEDRGMATQYFIGHLPTDIVVLLVDYLNKIPWGEHCFLYVRKSFVKLVIVHDDETFEHRLLIREGKGAEPEYVFEAKSWHDEQMEEKLSNQSILSMEIQTVTFDDRGILSHVNEKVLESGPGFTCRLCGEPQPFLSSTTGYVVPIFCEKCLDTLGDIVRERHAGYDEIEKAKKQIREQVTGPERIVDPIEDFIQMLTSYQWKTCIAPPYYQNSALRENRLLFEKGNYILTIHKPNKDYNIPLCSIFIKDMTHSHLAIDSMQPYCYQGSLPSPKDFLIIMECIEKDRRD